MRYFLKQQEHTAAMEIPSSVCGVVESPSEPSIFPRGDHEVCVDPNRPFWFVPSRDAETAVCRLSRGTSPRRIAEDPAVAGSTSSRALEMDLIRLQSSISLPDPSPYTGRSGTELSHLSEVWFHLTDQCNARCRHCLFSESIGSGRSLDFETVTSVIDQAYALGARVMCFTGGEPFVHPGFLDILRYIQKFDDLSAAILSNGIAVPALMNRLTDLDRERLHIQVSLDGPQDMHDRIRGDRGFARASRALDLMAEHGIPCSASMAVNPENLDGMAETVRIAHGLGVPIVHYMWHFRRGDGEAMEIIPLRSLLPHLNDAWDEARKLGVSIDNIEAIRSQVFSQPGTRFDLGNAGWESLAIAPDRTVYPTPAMVYLEGFESGSIDDGLEKVWRESPLLKRLRDASLMDVPAMAADPLRFIIGGGDLDHCCMNPNKPSDAFLGDDPYRPLAGEIALMLIDEAVREVRKPEHPGLILRMGDITTDCPSGEEVNFTHCNCLLSMGGGTRGLVRNFYSAAAETPDELILNPITFDQESISFIPEEARARMYGCGSPVADAGLKPGEVLVDLGSGTGVECFLAAGEVGPQGRAIGVDMTDAMLDIAQRASEQVAEALGYDNTEFRKGFLEDIPIDDNSADCVISNCVVNLSHNKRRVFGEILRILKPGGRLVISDVVAETEPPLHVRADHQLIGECIGGAMVQEYLLSMLRDVGFTSPGIVKRFPYRVVDDHPFFSLTFLAFKPAEPRTRTVIYGGPFEAVLMEDGTELRKGVRTEVTLGPTVDDETLAQRGIFLVDDATGEFVNSDAISSCACFVAPAKNDRELGEDSHKASGCLVCGSPLIYPDAPEMRTCEKCGQTASANAYCEAGHFVCDACHVTGPREHILHECLATSETDMTALLEELRAHASIPLHGPEHHGLVPGVILATYRNLGGNITDRDIKDGIERGSLIPGGSCAFMGACGAATGVGTALGIILRSNPLKPGERRTVQEVVASLTAKLSERTAARCCRRECCLVLQALAEVSGDILPIPLKAEADVTCRQFGQNAECIGAECPLHPLAKRRHLRAS